MYKKSIRVNIIKLLFKSIILLLLINLIIPGVMGVWKRESEYSTAYTYVFQYSMFTAACSYIAVILLYILIAVLIVRNIIKGEMKLIIALSIIVFFIWSLISIFEANLLKIFFSDVSTNLSLIPLFYLLGYNQTIFESAKKLTPYITVIMVGLILWSSISFISQYGITTETRASPSKEMYAIGISAFWCYALGISTEKGYHKYFRYFLGVCFLIGAFLIRSRSWVIQCILLLYTLRALNEGKKSYFKKTLSACSVLLVIIVIIVLFPNITNSLFSRISEDTRSGQYDTFFSQIDAISLIWGQGINASYSFLGNPSYKYFDNQFIYIMFYYGVVPILCMLGIIIGLYRNIKERLNTKDKVFIIGCRLMSFFFLSALGGLSVYYKIGWNVGTILVLIFIGQAHKIIKESKKMLN